MVTVRGITVDEASFGAPNMSIGDKDGQRSGWIWHGLRRDRHHRGGPLAPTVAEAVADARATYASGEWEYIQLGPWIIDGLDREAVYRLLETHRHGSHTAIGEFDLGDRVVFIPYACNEPRRLRSATHHATLAEARAEIDLAWRYAAEARGDALDRAGYEAVCARFGITPEEDAAIDSYGTRYFQVSFPEYPVAHVLAHSLAQRRLRGIDAERERARAARPPRPAAPERPTIRCCRCSEIGVWGESPFTTYGHLVEGDTAICDDCGA
jgi:hypothetical protein